MFLSCFNGVVMGFRRDPMVLTYFAYMVYAHPSTVVLPWYPMELPWKVNVLIPCHFLHGAIMLLPWCFHGGPMLPWRLHGDASIVIPWRLHGHPTVGASMVIPTLVLPWCLTFHDGDPMVLPWRCRLMDFHYYNKTNYRLRRLPLTLYYNYDGTTSTTSKYIILSMKIPGIV